MQSKPLKKPITVTVKSKVAKTKFTIKKSLKRGLDIATSIVAMTFLSPVLLLVGLAIKIESKGPVFFKQTRVGVNGKHFTMWKFRSMSVDAEQQKAMLNDQNEMANGVLFKMRKDPRITKVGTLIRKTSIDELPQLFNVLKGDMSLVGPRPPLPSEVLQYNRRDRVRMSVVPGITCYWQVSGRSDIPFAQQVELDIKYIETQSLMVDVALLARTVPAVVLAKGAY